MEAAPQLGADIRIEAGTVRCVGAWTARTLERADRRLRAAAWPAGPEVVVDASAVAALDLAGAWVLRGAVRTLEGCGRRVELRLRPDHVALVQMADAPGLPIGAPGASSPPSLLSRVGARTVEAGRELVGVLAFLGDAVRLAVRRPALVRWRAVPHHVQASGLEAMPIVGLLTFLMGVVIAYLGATQLRRYGGTIYVADLVGFAMLRELSPLLTAIVVAGRSGSAFAAEIGTMKVTEEIDALGTLGISPMGLLVLPKILALGVALPLLTVYADAMGVAGGMIVARGELAVHGADFLERLQKAMTVKDFLVGPGKALLFAGAIGVIGCHHGFEVSGDAESVGRHTTESVVRSIFLVIVLDAVLSVTFSLLRI